MHLGAVGFSLFRCRVHWELNQQITFFLSGGSIALFILASACVFIVKQLIQLGLFWELNYPQRSPPLWSRHPVTKILHPLKDYRYKVIQSDSDVTWNRNKVVGWNCFNAWPTAGTYWKPCLGAISSIFLPSNTVLMLCGHCSLYTVSLCGFPGVFPSASITPFF